MSISELVTNIPIILEYFIPGYLSIVFYQRLASGSNSAQSEKIRIGTAVCISTFARFVLQTLYYWLIPFPHFAFLVKMNVPELRFVIECVLVLCATFGFYWLLKSRPIRKFYSLLTKTTLSHSVFESCELSTTCLISVYLSDKVIKGRMIVYDLSGNDQWIALDKYIVKDETGKVFDNWMYHQYERYLVPVKEITAIVIHYRDGDKLIPCNYMDARIDAQAQERARIIMNESLSHDTQSKKSPLS